MRKIRAFGREVDREEAYEVIINDLVCDICHAQNTDSLRELLFDGWKPLHEWTDEELEEFIGGLCAENQPGGGCRKQPR